MRDVMQDVMRALGLSTQAQLASLLGISPSAVSRYAERGISAESWRKIQQLAREQGVVLPDSFYETGGRADRGEAA